MDISRLAQSIIDKLELDISKHKYRIEGVAMLHDLIVEEDRKTRDGRESSELGAEKAPAAETNS